MEFEYNINQVIPEVISLISRDCLPGRFSAHRPVNNKQLEFVIDELGRKSAQAQNLSGPITYFQKSILNGHHIYVLKDSQSNNGLGSVIGFIKVGKKRLFLLDHYGNQNELYPLCVLDFYVHESQQRKGCGLKLFCHMLEAECVEATHLAIDRPSHKFLSFLKKHFRIVETIPQVNNFVIFEGFFDNRSDVIRISATNEKYDNARFRPLSRAVSDDVIRRHRGVEMNRSAHDVSRPISGYEMGENYGYFQTRNNRRRRWNPDGILPPVNDTPVRSNFYSRFSHQRQYTPTSKPPISSISRLRPNSGSSHSEKDEKASATEETTIEVKSFTDVVPEKDNCSSLHSAVASVDKVSEVKSAPISAASRYKNPSDMLKELSAKDERSLQETASSHNRYQKRWLHQNGRTGWNIFGVPVASHWSLKQGK